MDTNAQSVSDTSTAVKQESELPTVDCPKAIQSNDAPIPSETSSLEVESSESKQESSLKEETNCNETDAKKVESSTIIVENASSKDEDKEKNNNATPEATEKVIVVESPPVEVTEKVIEAEPTVETTEKNDNDAGKDNESLSEDTDSVVEQEETTESEASDQTTTAANEPEPVVEENKIQKQTESNSDDTKEESKERSQINETTIPANQSEPVVEERQIYKQPENRSDDTKKAFDNQIKDIISDIDSSIRAQEKITQLKEQELQLMIKQQQLSNEIQEQQLLAQKLVQENSRIQQELFEKQKQQEYKIQMDSQQPIQLKQPTQQIYQQGQTISIQEPHADLQSENSYKIKESTNVSRTVDLRKIFTPAVDSPEIIPKNRKLYASSAFYSPTLHPTVEDQVELARRISHSLSDISNQKSKGQSMYVNRKKRSVKWVHEGCAQVNDEAIESTAVLKENANSKPEINTLDKMPLKLIMNPLGIIRDYNSLKESINVESGLLSPDNCAELITALQLHKGRGAELFAKRRRKADSWVVDADNAGTDSPSGIPDYQPYQPRSPTSPSIVPAYSDAGKHRVQLNIHQDKVLEKYRKPGVQVLQSPWQAALQTGSASTAFVEPETQYQPVIQPRPAPVTVQPPTHFQSDVTDAATRSTGNYGSFEQKQQQFGKCAQAVGVDSQRELAYKPNIAQGWGSHHMSLPKDFQQGYDDQYFNSYVDNEFEEDPYLQKIRYNNFYQDQEFTISVQQRLADLERFQHEFLMQQQQQCVKPKPNQKSEKNLAFKQYEKGRKLLSPNNNINRELHDGMLTSNEKVDSSESNIETMALPNVHEIISSFEQQCKNEQHLKFKKKQFDDIDVDNHIYLPESCNIGGSIIIDSAKGKT